MVMVMHTMRARIHGQALRFAAVGLSGVAVNAAVLSLLFGLLRWPITCSAIVAAEVAMVNNYVWNDRWTFGKPRLSLERLVRFNLASCGGLALAAGATTLLVDAGAPYMPASLAGIALGAACNYTVSRLWVWRAT